MKRTVGIIKKLSLRDINLNYQFKKYVDSNYYSVIIKFLSRKRISPLKTIIKK